MQLLIVVDAALTQRLDTQTLCTWKQPRYKNSTPLTSAAYNLFQKT